MLYFFELILEATLNNCIDLFSYIFSLYLFYFVTQILDTLLHLLRFDRILSHCVIDLGLEIHELLLKGLPAPSTLILPATHPLDPLHPLLEPLHPLLRNLRRIGATLVDEVAQLLVEFPGFFAEFVFQGHQGAVLQALV